MRPISELAAAPLADRARRAALWSCLGAGFATLFDATTVAYTAPALAETFDASAAGIQWFLASFSLTFGLGLVPAGRLGDAYGRRRLFLAGLVVFLVGGVLSAGGPDIAWVIAGRFVQGLGAGFVSAQVLGVIQDLYHGPSRIRAFVAYTAVGAVAGLVGPIVAGVILTVAPTEVAWRLILLVPLPLTVLAIVLAWRGLPRTDVRAARVSLDLPGDRAARRDSWCSSCCRSSSRDCRRRPNPSCSRPARCSPSRWCGGNAGTPAAVGSPCSLPCSMRSRGFIAGNLVALTWFGALLAQGGVLTIYLLQETGAPAMVVAAVLPSRCDRPPARLTGQPSPVRAVRHHRARGRARRRDGAHRRRSPSPSPVVDDAALLSSWPPSTASSASPAGSSNRRCAR